MSFLKTGSAKIVQAATTLAVLEQFSPSRGLVKRAAKRIEAIDLDPDAYIYLRNRAISALELHGPNQNWDAFEYSPLSDRYASFIGDNISVDHLAHTHIGMVLESDFIKISDFRFELDIPMLPPKDTLAVLSERCARDTLFNHVMGYAKNNGLVRNSDRKMLLEAVANHLCLGGWVENIWAIEKEAAEDYLRGLATAILNNKVTDTSMGCLVNQAVCSHCGNIATGELPPEEDFCDCIGYEILDRKGKPTGRRTGWKGRPLPQYTMLGLIVVPYEINRDFNFFEDSLILPRTFGGKAGGEGADKDAKLLEVYGTRKKIFYMESNPNPPAAVSYNPDKYALIGDVPKKVEENKEEFKEQMLEFSQDSQEEDVEASEYPEGTYINCVHEGEKVNAIVIEEGEDYLMVAIDGIDEPVKIPMKGVEVIEYPEEMDTEDIENIRGVPEREMHPENRSASLSCT